MLKALGAACVLLGAGALGLTATGRLRDRVQTLGRLIDGLLFLEEELSFRLTPMPTLLETLSKRTDGAAGRFFGGCLARFRSDPAAGFRSCWRQAATCLSMLHPDELDTLLALGDILGRYDGEGQQAALRQAVNRLERFRREAEAERGRLGRVYAAVSLAAGLTAVIVLI